MTGIAINSTQGPQFFVGSNDDGTTVINVMSRARTKLGRLLSNFAHSPFEHPLYGKFDAMEGYWHWCSTGKRLDALRDLTGAAARNMGRLAKKVHYPEFERDILLGLHCKLRDNPIILQLLLESDPSIPLAHYFYYNGIANDQYESNHFWLMELEDIRNGKPLLVNSMIPNT